MAKQIISEEFRRMQKLAGIQLNENEMESFSPEKWTSLGPDFTFDEDDNLYIYKNSFIFSFNKEKNTLESEIQYLDFGDSRDEGEEIVDSLVDQLEQILNKNNFQYEILTTSSAYMFTIYL